MRKKNSHKRTIIGTLKFDLLKTKFKQIISFTIKFLQHSVNLYLNPLDGYKAKKYYTYKVSAGNKAHLSFLLGRSIYNTGSVIY